MKLVEFQVKKTQIDEEIKGFRSTEFVFQTRKECESRRVNVSEHHKVVNSVGGFRWRVAGCQFGLGVSHQFVIHKVHVTFPYIVPVTKSHSSTATIVPAGSASVTLPATFLVQTVTHIHLPLSLVARAHECNR